MNRPAWQFRNFNDWKEALGELLKRGVEEGFSDEMMLIELKHHEVTLRYTLPK